MQKNIIWFRSLMLMGLVLIPQNVSAQSVDYSGLEQLFGESVTTSATGKPQKASEAPVDMEIITADDIRRSGAENISQILGRRVGVVNWQQTRASSNVGIHGQNYSLNPSLLVLVNGRQVYNDFFGFTQWSDIPVQVQEIKQIEIVKGPNTALFGFNAVSGVINIITYNPKYDDVGDAGIKIGNDGYRKAHFLDTVSFSDRASVRFSGGRAEMNRFDNRSKAHAVLGTMPNEADYDSINADGLIQLADKTQLRLEGSHNHNNSEVIGYYLPYREDSHSYSMKSTLSSSTDFGLVEANLYQNHNIGTYGGFTTDNRVTVGQLQDIFRIGNDHTFRIMGEYRKNISSGNIFGAGAEIQTETLASSAMWNWHINPSWELTNAIRFDSQAFSRNGPRVEPQLFPNGNADFDDHIDAVSANSGLVWKATPDDSFRLSFARGVQPASHLLTGMWIVYTGVNFGGGTVLVEGNPHAKPTYVHNYELGYDHKINEIEGGFHSSLYYRKTRSIWNLYTELDLSGATPALSSGTIGNSDTIGVDFGLDGKFATDWIWDVNYAFQKGNDDLTRDYVIQSLNYQDTVPHHIVNAHLGWAKGPWEVDGFVQAASSFTAMSFESLNQYAMYKIDGFFTSGGRIAYTFDHDITVALSGVDISQARVQNNPGFENERQVFLSVSKKF